MVENVQKARPLTRPIALRIDLRYLLYPCLVVFLVTAPLMRGLFFPADYFPYQFFAGVMLAVGVLDAALRRKTVLGTPLTLAFLALAVAYGLSCLTAVSRVEAARGFVRYLTYFSVFWLAWHLSRDRKGARALMVTLFLSAAFVALAGILAVAKVFFFPGAASGVRISSTLQYPNALAAYMMFGSLIGLSLMTLEDNLFRRLAFAGATYLQALVFLSSYSRGGWAVYPVILILFCAGMPKQHRSKAIAYASSVIVPVLLVVRQFTIALQGKVPQSSLKIVLFGLAATAVAVASYEAFRNMIERMPGVQARTFLQWAGGISVALVFCAYSVVFLAQFGIGFKGALPTSILQRMVSIDLADPSLGARGFMTKDALRVFVSRPILGGGAGAWNALYHQYQSKLYWTTEVHNHYAQVLVETGLVGFLAYLSIWVLLAIGILKHMRRKTSSYSAARVWGLFCACLAVAIHSAMDFELSLPAVAIQLWAAIGILAAEIPFNKSHRDLGAYASAGLVLVAALIAALSFTMGRGVWYGSVAGGHLLRRDYLTSVKLYELAAKWDPLNAAYHVDMGQAYSALAAIEGRDDLRGKALVEFQKARSLEPLEATYLLKEVESLAILGETGKAAAAARELARQIPLDVRSYELLARTTLANFFGRRQAEEPSQVEMLDEVLQIQGTLDSLDTVQPVGLSPTLKKYLGQAAYLKGDLQLAATHLESAAKDKANKDEASDWLSAVRILSGAQDAQGASPQVAEILGYASGGVR